MSSPTLTWIYLEEVVLILDTLVTGMKPGMDTEMREDTSVTIHQGLHQGLFIIVDSDYFIIFRGLAPNFRQDSIRSGYISDHESRSGYEHRGEYTPVTSDHVEYTPVPVSDTNYGDSFRF